LRRFVQSLLGGGSLRAIGVGLALVGLGAALLHRHIIERVNELVHHEFALLVLVATAARLLVRPVFH
jgi:hypothetical protein